MLYYWIKLTNVPATHKYETWDNDLNCYDESVAAATETEGSSLKKSVFRLNADLSCMTRDELTGKGDKKTHLAMSGRACLAKPAGI